MPKQQKGEKIMFVNFETINTLVRENFFGGNKSFDAKIFNDRQNRILLGKLVPGASIGFHSHEDGSEIVYIISGTGTAAFDESEEKLVPGVCHYCPKGHGHDMANNGDEDLVFFAVVTKE